MFWDEVFFSPNIISFVLTTLISTLVLFFVGKIVVERLAKKASFPSQWVAATFLVSTIFLFGLIQFTHPLSRNQVDATLEVEGTRAVANARSTWEAEIFPTVVSLLDPLETGTITFSGTSDNPVTSTHRFSFVAGVSDPRAVPADLTLQGCRVDSAGLSIYCNVQARDIWSMGKLSLEEIITLSANFYRPDSFAVEEGDSYVIVTANGNLAKFRFINPVIGDDLKSYSLTIDWVYQPNKRDDFNGPQSP